VKILCILEEAWGMPFTEDRGQRTEDRYCINQLLQFIMSLIIDKGGLNQGWLQRGFLQTSMDKCTTKAQFHVILGTSFAEPLFSDA
jgi:hypothetical protein